MEQDSIQAEEVQDRLDFVLARNDFLDAFAGIETVVGKIVQSCGHAPSSEPFSHKLRTFRSAEKTSMIAKANHARRDRLADAIAAILPLRADIVHSAMRIACLDGQGVALFTNAQTAHCPCPQVRIIDLSTFRALNRELRAVRKALAELGTPINPASSPPPPSPDAAGGP